MSVDCEPSNSPYVPTGPLPNVLARKLTEVMAEVEGISKNKENVKQGYKFASEEMFLRAVRGPLAARGVLMVPYSARIDDLHRGETKSGGSMTTVTGTVSYVFIDSETGERLTVQVLSSGQDSGDKHSYKLMTGALKYALKQTLLLPTGDDPEYEGAPQPRRQPAPKPAGPPAMDPLVFAAQLGLIGLTVADAKAKLGMAEDEKFGARFPTLEAALAAVQQEVAK